jgi:membrane protein DedA with SNARE-associated domain/pimeloyl-ACP methyl ester carboxylesterase
VRLAYRDLVPADAAAPVLLLLHGNPGEGGSARPCALSCDALPRRGTGSPRLRRFDAARADASLRAQAGYALALLDALRDACARRRLQHGRWDGDRAGGSGADRVASLALLASIGAQEFELLGDYHVNHLVHVLQLAVIEAGLVVVPHFGALDRTPIGASYARTFVASDQRRLRPILAKWSGPTLILHGRVDPLVPLAAAREHHRLVPQSELVVLDAGHLLPWRQRDEVTAHIQEFVTRAESGRPVTRADAEPARIEFAAQPFDARLAGPHGALGVATFALLVLLASLVSEDLTCIGVGLLVGSRQVGPGVGIGAAAFALFAGDLLLVAAGRWFGPVLLRRTRLGRASRAEEVARGERRLRHVGPIALLASRFVPGSRLPTYLAAGALRMPLSAVALWLAVGALLWAPILVGASASLGSLAFERVAELRHLALPVALAIAALVYVASQLGPQLLSFRGRRLLLDPCAGSATSSSGRSGCSTRRWCRDRLARAAPP